jgi:stearoyl-CoA desaturase (delta-9 desaturase)
MKENFYPREWFFIFFQLLGFIAFSYAVMSLHSFEYWVLSALGYFLITCLGITVTFHRLLAHRSYSLWKPLEYCFSFFGNLGCTGSSVGWVFVHRTHHKFTDIKGDPHSPVTLGIIGAIIGDYSTKFNKWKVKDIVVDPVHRFMHEYYMLIVTMVALLLFSIDYMVAIHLFFIPVFLNTIASRMSNWIDHDPKLGIKELATNDSSHNVWWWSLLTFGEGWHNNHHARPWDYQIGKKWYQFDPGRYVIEFLMMCKLANKNANYQN